MTALVSSATRLMLALLLCIGLAQQAHAGTLDIDNSTPTGWTWYTNQSPSQVASRMQSGDRVVSVEVDTVSPLRLTVALVPNSGSYYRPSRAFYYGTPSYIESVRNGRRITCLAPYVLNNQVYFVVAFVGNTGSHQKGWGYYYGSLSSVTNAVYQAKLRPTDIGTYVINGNRYYTAVGVNNTGSDARTYWWYFGASSTYLTTQLIQNGGRYVDIHAAGSGYNAIMVRGSNMPKWWYYRDVTGTYLADKLGQNGARLISLQRNGSRYNACMINNSNALTTQVGEIIRGIPATTGIHMKQVGGPVLVWLNGDRKYEPASSLKTLHHFTAIRDVARRISMNLSSNIVSYQGSPTGCPNTSLPKTTERLDTILSAMMKNSDNARTFSVEQHYTRAGLNSVASLLGMTNTQLNHSIGCGLPANRFTLEDAAKLFEAAESGSYLGRYKSDFYRLMANYSLSTAIDQENAKVGLPSSTLNNFKSYVLHVAKGGSYGVGGKLYRSHVGLMRLPWLVGGKIEVRAYAYGNFIDGASSTTNFNKFGESRDVMRRAIILQALQSWKNAKVNGSVATFGQGCSGRNGVVTQFSTGTPELGQIQNFNVRNGRGSSFAILQLGLSNTQWGLLPLPFDLGLVGAQGCTLYNEPLLSFVQPTSASGTAKVGFRHPSTRDFIGLRLYTQFVVLDAAANQLGLTYSNGLRTTIGGWSQ
jgi:hypothetical protein